MGKVPRIGMLSCLGQQDKETSLFLYHCLNYDLIESGETWDEAWRNLKKVIKYQIEHCSAYNPDGLMHSAPRAAWNKFAELLQADPQSLVVESIDIESQPPLLEGDMPIWLQGVGSSGNNCSLAHA